MGKSIVRLIGLCVSLFLLLPIQGEAQKIKYKDLFYLLDGKKYEEAAPFLKRFLSDPKEVDHPNANYQMGLTYKDMSEKADIFIDNALVWLYTDSAIYYLDKAKVLIDDRDVKRNDEFYQQFAKRDMRTGKVSVKSFDVMFSIEETIDGLRERQRAVGDANSELENVITNYNKSREFYIVYKNTHNDMNEVLLRANLETISVLNQLSEYYDAYEKSFSRMIEMLREIPHTDYAQKIIANPITDLASQGESQSHFLDAEIQTWNYGKWAIDARSIILSEVLPLKASMVKHDKALADMLASVESTDEISPKDLDDLKVNFDGDLLLKYDQDPLPIKLFNLQYSELDYLQQVINNKTVLDSVNYSLKIGLVEKELHLLDKTDSIIQNITKLDIDEQIRNYKDFVEERYHGFLGLDKFLKDKLSDIEEYRANSMLRMNELRARNSYVVVNDQKIVIDTTFVADSLTFSGPIYTTDTFSAGVKTSDTGRNGYVVEVNPQRETTFYYQFALDSVAQLRNPRIIASADKTGQVYYMLYVGDTIHIQAEEKKNAQVVNTADSTATASINTSLESSGIAGDGVIYPAFMCKIYKIDGIAWMVPLDLNEEPIGIRINDLGQLIIDGKFESEGNQIKKMIVLNNKDGGEVAN